MPLRIDTHVHVAPPEYRAALPAAVRAQVPPWSMAEMERFRARFEIDVAVVSLGPPGVSFGKADEQLALARRMNDWLARLVGKNGDHYAALATLPLPDVGAAVAEVARALDELRLDGIALLSHYNGTYLGDPAFEPVLEELDRRAAYVFVHPTFPPHALPLPDHPVWLYEFTFDTTRALVSLLYGGALERFPRIRFQFAHLAGTVPFLAERLGSLANRDPAAARRAPLGAAEYLRRVFYDTGLSNAPAAIEHAAAVGGPDRVVFGTDWPYAHLVGDDPAPALASLDPGFRTRIEATNPLTLLPRLAAARS